MCDDMIKYKFTVILIALFIIGCTIALTTWSGGTSEDVYNPGIIVGAISVLLCCPAFIFDYRSTEKFKEKQKERQLKMQLRQQELAMAIQQQGLDLEQKKIYLKQQKIKLEEKSEAQPIKKYCVYCAKEIDPLAKICPFCGSEVPQVKTTNSQQSQESRISTQAPPIIIQQIQQPSFKKRLVEWIVSEILYCIIVSVLMTFFIVWFLILSL
jgi:hypothetical protein